MEQRTLKLDDGSIIYCYDDGSVEWYNSYHKKLYRSFGSLTNLGYLRIHIRQKSYFIHRLIALAFVSNPCNYTEVDHIDRNQENNLPNNLRWASRSINSSNREVVELAFKRDGFRHKDDRYRYKKLHEINLMKPNGKKSSVCISEEERKILTPLTQKERYFKLKEIRDAVKE